MESPFSEDSYPIPNELMHLLEEETTWEDMMKTYEVGIVQELPPIPEMGVNITPASKEESSTPVAEEKGRMLKKLKTSPKETVTATNELKNEILTERFNIRPIHVSRSYNNLKDVLIEVQFTNYKQHQISFIRSLQFEPFLADFGESIRGRINFSEFAFLRTGSIINGDFMMASLPIIELTINDNGIAQFKQTWFRLIVRAIDIIYQLDRSSMHEFIYARHYAAPINPESPTMLEDPFGLPRDILYGIIPELKAFESTGLQTIVPTAQANRVVVSDDTIIQHKNITLMMLIFYYGGQTKIRFSLHSLIKQGDFIRVIETPHQKNKFNKTIVYKYMYPQTELSLRREAFWNTEDITSLEIPLEELVIPLSKRTESIVDVASCIFVLTNEQKSKVSPLLKNKDNFAKIYMICSKRILYFALNRELKGIKTYVPGFCTPITNTHMIMGGRFEYLLPIRPWNVAKFANETKNTSLIPSDYVSPDPEVENFQYMMEYASVPLSAPTATIIKNIPRDVTQETVLQSNEPFEREIKIFFTNYKPHLISLRDSSQFDPFIADYGQSIIGNVRIHQFTKIENYDDFVFVALMYRYPIIKGLVSHEVHFTDYLSSPTNYSYVEDWLKLIFKVSDIHDYFNKSSEVPYIMPCFFTSNSHELFATIDETGPPQELLYTVIPELKFLDESKFIPVTLKAPLFNQSIAENLNTSIDLDMLKFYYGDQTYVDIALHSMITKDDYFFLKKTIKSTDIVSRTQLEKPLLYTYRMSWKQVPGGAKPTPLLLARNAIWNREEVVRVSLSTMVKSNVDVEGVVVFMIKIANDDKGLFSKKVRGVNLYCMCSVYNLYKFLEPQTLGKQLNKEIQIPVIGFCIPTTQAESLPFAAGTQFERLISNDFNEGIFLTYEQVKANYPYISGEPGIQTIRHGYQ